MASDHPYETSLRDDCKEKKSICAVHPSIPQQSHDNLDPHLGRRVVESKTDRKRCQANLLFWKALIGQEKQHNVLKLPKSCENRTAMLWK